MVEAVEVRLEGSGKNALSSEVLKKLRADLQAAGGAPVLVTGAGDAFSAGLNLKEVMGYATAEAMAPFLRLLDDVCAELFDYPGPTVACIHGHAIAGGAVVALCCDVRVVTADPRVRVGLNEVALGVSFPPRIMALVKARLPVATVHEVVLGAGLYAPEDAARVGLVDRVAEDVEGTARALVAALGRLDQAAYAAAKQELREGVTAVPARLSERFYGELLPMWVSEAVRGRLMAALKRTGRAHGPPGAR